jgi:hypothetical protein
MFLEAEGTMLTSLVQTKGRHVLVSVRQLALQIPISNLANM